MLYLKLCCCDIFKIIRCPDISKLIKPSSFALQKGRPPKSTRQQKQTGGIIDLTFSLVKTQTKKKIYLIFCTHVLDGCLLFSSQGPV